MFYWYLGILFLPFTSLNAALVKKAVWKYKDANYGPYDITITKFIGICSSKAQNMATFSTALDVQDGDSIAILNITYQLPTVIDQMKMVIYTVNGTAKNLIMRQSITNPCTHFIFGAIMEQHLKTDSKCVIKKGNYVFRVSFMKVTNSLFSAIFFYGNYFSKFISYSKKVITFNVEVYSQINKKLISV